MKIDGNHFLVTGGASGLGLAVVKRLLSDGGKVSIFDMNSELGKTIEQELKSDNILFVKANIISEEEVIKGIELGIKQFGPLRSVVHCAGIAIPAKILGKNNSFAKLDTFYKVIQVNLIGSFNILRLAAHYMRNNSLLNDERGTIVLVSSIAAFEGQIGQCSYSAAKGGVISMTLPAARELAEHGIRVNSICPGIFHTPMMAELPAKAQDSLAASVPFPKRLGHPQEFADLAISLISNQYYNATVVRLDGGIRMAAL